MDTFSHRQKEPIKLKKGESMKFLAIMGLLLPMSVHAANYQCNDVSADEGKISYDLTETNGAYDLEFTSVEHAGTGADALVVGAEIEISSQLEVKYDGEALPANCKKIEAPELNALGNGQFQFSFFLDCGEEDQLELVSTCSAK